ncbi:MAG: hypothetical protein C0418_04840 [Coriobacteriaceae bacterium]|nr:hypothetical protein [Coriobacteriaceae bacterium]
MRTVLLDTNVLLADPNALLAYPDAAVILPETVLAELDKIKTSRVDPDLRFRGREVSRILFELSEQGLLTGGIDLPGGGSLRVVPLESEELPEGLSARNADDRILGVALQVCGNCDDMVIVTNDLNMLLKAQTLGLKVERHGDGVERSFGRRYIIRPFQRYRVPLTILAIALAVFAAVIYLVVWASPGTSTSGMPRAFRDVLTDQQERFYDALVTLEARPSDTEARLAVANTYFDLYEQTKDVNYTYQAIRNYEEYLNLRPDDADARADLATALFSSGQTDRAIQEVSKVLREHPGHVNANYNLGIFYWRGRNDLPAAYAQFRKVEQLTAGSADAKAQLINRSVNSALEQVSAEASATGIALPEDGTQ